MHLTPHMHMQILGQQAQKWYLNTQIRHMQLGVYNCLSTPLKSQALKEHCWIKNSLFFPYLYYQ